MVWTYDPKRNTYNPAITRQSHAEKIILVTSTGQSKSWHCRVLHFWPSPVPYGLWERWLGHGRSGSTDTSQGLLGLPQGASLKTTSLTAEALNRQSSA